MERVVDGVHQLSLGGNAFIVDGDDGVVLVDTGLPGRQAAIVAGLASLGRSVHDVHAIVLTHGHTDHLGGAAVLRRNSGATLVAPMVEADVVRGDRPPPVPPVLDRPLLRQLARMLPSPEATDVDEVVEAGPLPVSADLVAIPTPGHTAGHTSFLLDRAGGVLFVGDAAVAHRRGGIARGAMNRRTAVFDDSLRTMARHHFDVACFGHSAPIRSGASATFRRFVERLG